MTYTGRVENGVIVFDQPQTTLPEGAEVRVELVGTLKPLQPTLADQFAEFIGQVEGLPTDMAQNHDHYIHGTPKNP